MVNTSHLKKRLASRWTGNLLPGSSNAGVSLIGAVVLLGVIGLVAMVIVNSQSHTIAVQDIIRSKRSTQDTRQAFEAELMRVFRANACFDPSVVFPASGTTPIGGTANIRLTQSPITAVDLTTVVPESMKDTLDEARTRCGTPRLSNTQDPTQRYFCLEFIKTAQTPRGSFLADNTAFAEVLVESIDFRTGQAVDCQQALATPATGGARIVYAIYWLSRSANGATWQQLRAGFNVAAM